MSSKTETIIKPSFQFKAEFFPITVLKMLSGDLEQFTHELDSTLKKAPNYFTQAPVVIDVTHTDREAAPLDIKAITDILKTSNIKPIGIRGLAESEQHLAEAASLALIKAQTNTQSQPHAKTNSEESPKATPTTPSVSSKTIVKPIRAGTQVYAKGGDLVILSAVNSGAECIADGNIHVYGPIRGRVLAGASGNKNARIFCKSLEAELVSIAGHYKIKEDIKLPTTPYTLLQIYLKEEKLQIQAI